MNRAMHRLTRHDPRLAAAAAGDGAAGRCSRIGRRWRPSSTASTRRRGQRRAAAFIGLENYRQIVDDPVFWQALRTICGSRVGTIPVSIGLAMLMALWVNDRIAGRTLVRMAYFTPTVLPMIAVANIWLFFYTPQYGLLAQVLRRSAGPRQNWLGSKDTALICVTIVAIWKEAGFFMIFYLAALQQIPPSLGEAAALEGASRLYFFRRVQFPAADADDAVRARQRGDQRLPHGRPHHRHDARRARQRDVAAAVPRLRAGLQFLGHGLAAAMTVMLLLGLWPCWRSASTCFLEKRIHYR